MKITIKDIAERCNTSPATVSRVLSGSDYPVREELRNQILNTAMEMRYRPNPFGRMLRKSRSREVGVVIPSISNPYYGELLESIEKACYISNLKPTIRSSYNSCELEREHIEALLESQVCGILISSIQNLSDVLPSTQTENMPPIILFDQGIGKNDQRFLRVSYDFRKAGYMAATHLLETGHQSIAYVTPSFDRPSRKQIGRGIRDALDQFVSLGTKYQTITLPEDTAWLNDSSRESNRKIASLLADEIQREQEPMDGLIVLNDMLAISLMTELRDRGISVPEDLSIISHDDIWLAEMVSPRLTTISQSAPQTGEAAVRLLNQHLAKSVQERTTVITPELISRETVIPRMTGKF